MRTAALLLLSVPALAAPPDSRDDPLQSIRRERKVELGRRLFMDPTVSRTGRVSCSSCHLPEHGFSDPRALSEDEWGMSQRHSQPLVDLQGGSAFHWDGEFVNLRELLTLRFGSIGEGVRLASATRERGFEVAKAAGRKPDTASFNMMLHNCGPYPFPTDLDRAPAGKAHWRPREVPLPFRLDEDDRYDQAFEATFGAKEITRARIFEALEAYVLSLRTGESRFDRHLAGDPRALTDSQRRGVALFTGKANCAACHLVEGGRPKLTDGGFHNTGVAFRPMPFLEQPDLGGPKLIVVRKDFGNLMIPWGLLHFADGGAGEINFVEADWGKFKMPSLRDVARRAPYMHDGSFATLEDVVRYYDRGAMPNERLDERIRPLGLTDGEVGDLVAFLGALSGDERPGIGPAPPRRQKFRVRIVDLLGRPMSAQRVEIHPAGDRLKGGTPDDPPKVAVANSDGWLAFWFPRWTHVRLVSDTHEIHYDWLIPDCAPPMQVMAAPRNTVALKLRVEVASPDQIVARWAGSDDEVARFRRVRSLAKGTAIYVGKRRASPYPWVSAVLCRERAARGAARELDLSGGWTDPIDERREPKE